MLAADCRNVGLFCKAICCSSSSVIVFFSDTEVCARPAKATRNKTKNMQSANRVTQRSGDTVSALTSRDFTGVIRLFMLVLHSRHIHLHWLIAFLLFSKLHDLVVPVWRQHAHERHHYRHKATPAGTQAEVFRFVDDLIHRHHGTFHEGILRKTRYGVRILADLWLAHLHVGHILVRHRVVGFQWRIRHSYEYGISGTPRGLWLSSSFRAGDDKLMAVKMDRMVVHTEVDETDADALPVPHDERSVGWTRLSVEGEPVELHVHGVRHLDVRQDGVLLHNDCEIFIGARIVWFLGVHDER